MTDHEQLHELYDLSNEGEAEWWPSLVAYDPAWSHDGVWPRAVWLYGHTVDLVYDDALDLVRAEAERWLVERGWVFTCSGHERFYAGLTPEGYTISFTSLAEAIKHEMEHNQ